MYIYTYEFINGLLFFVLFLPHTLNKHAKCAKIFVIPV